MNIEGLITELKTTLPGYEFKYELDYPFIQRDRATGRFTPWHYDYSATPDYDIYWSIRHAIYGKAVGRVFLSHELVEDNGIALTVLSCEIPEEYRNLIHIKEDQEKALVKLP